MWLLNTTSLELEYFTSCKDKNVRYAILSHTWEDGEVTFQELNSGAARFKRGYDKILMTCQRAQEQGYSYAWVDCCCINKESSAELSEAINSMWDWYCSAEICYVYLSDVDTRSQWEPQFRASRWFTRGWTLQELLAPSVLDFFSSDWTFIVRKMDCIPLLHEITGIDRPVLRDRGALVNYVIARKMSWAVGRQTSRVEDRAYSLLGIFDTNMPLLYGEGENAFIRLQERIILTSSDLSFLVWKSREEMNMLNIRNMLFASSPDDFEIGKRVVSWSTNSVTSNHTLTSRGIELHSMLFFEDEGEVLGILNCRFEDNLHGPLALRLCQQDPSTRMAKMVWPNRNDFWIGEHLDDRACTLDNRLSSSKRLKICASYSTSHQSEQAVTVLRHHPLNRQHAHVRNESSSKLWVRQSESSSEDFEIVEASPGNLWNRSTGVMYSLESVDPSDSISVVLRFKSFGILTKIVFSGTDRHRGLDLFEWTATRSSWEKIKTRYYKHGPQAWREQGSGYSTLWEDTRVMADYVGIVHITKLSHVEALS